MNDLQRAPKSYAPSLPERTEHRTWIKGRAATLLSHYWREDDDPALLAAIGKDWADVLEGIPQEYIQLACVQYQRDEPRRKPTPGSIYQIAMALIPKPTLASPPVARRFTREEQDAYEASVASDRVNPKRKAEAEAVLAEMGYLKKMGGGDA